MKQLDRYAVLMALGIGLVVLLSGLAIGGPLWWPDLGATKTTVTVTYPYPSCGGER